MNGNLRIRVGVCERWVFRKYVQIKRPGGYFWSFGFWGLFKRWDRGDGSGVVNVFVVPNVTMMFVAQDLKYFGWGWFVDRDGSTRSGDRVVLVVELPGRGIVPTFNPSRTIKGIRGDTSIVNSTIPL
jgi:hypothetical protein